MVLLQHTWTIEIKEWVPSYELMRTNFIKKKNQSLCNFKIVELTVDMIVNSIVSNKQPCTLSWALCMKINTLSLRVVG